MRKGQPYGGLVFWSTEPYQGGLCSIHVEMWAIHGTTREMPVVRMSDAGLRDQRSCSLRSKEMSRIFSTV
jgi:hypothetical protein